MIINSNSKRQLSDCRSHTSIDFLYSFKKSFDIKFLFRSSFVVNVTECDQSDRFIANSNKTANRETRV